MNKIITLTLIAIAITACSVSNEQKAKQLIKDHLKSTMNDYSSYEPIEFSQLDTVYSSYYEDSTYKVINRCYESSNEFLKTIEKYIEDANEFNSRIGRIVDRRGMAFEKYLPETKNKVDSLSVAMKNFRHNYKPKMTGFSMNHKMRGKNAFGANVVNEMVFFFDNSLSKVTDVMDAVEYKKLMDEYDRVHKMMDELGI